MNIVLYSEDNFVWTSMQEIIPGLVDCWLEASKKSKQDVVVINLDKEELKDHMPSLMKAENLILTSFNLKISNAAILIREKLGVDARIHFHLHGLASVGCWPLFEFGLGNILKECDVFYSTCTKDRETFELSFSNAQCLVIPFHSEINVNSNRKNMKRPTFIFVGRLAEQKNLHQLLWIVSQIERDNPDLDFELKLYGKVDELGSPNMDIESIDYMGFLSNLSEGSSKIKFEGFVPRDKLDDWVSNNEHIFISPSLHSDENFGMAALKSLLSGNQAILSDWGGHHDFAVQFKDQVTLVPVHSSEYGPCLDPQELKLAIVNKCKNYGSQKITTDYYGQETVVSQYVNALETKGGESENLVRSELAEKVHEVRNKLIGKKHCQCFESYKDPNAQQFFKGYGMGSPIERSESVGIVAPWSSEEGFVDPHKGKVENMTTEQLLKNGWLL